MMRHTKKRKHLLNITEDRKSKKLKIKENIFKFIDSLSQQELIEIRNYIDLITPKWRSVIEKKLDKLIDKIKSLLDQQILRIEHLISPYENCKSRGNEKKTSKIQSITHKKITPSQFNVAAKKIIKQNKKEYSAKFVKLITDISNIRTVSLSAATECTNKMIAFFTGEILDKKLSTGTLSQWNKEVSTISLEQNRPRSLQLPFYSYGAMANKSTR
ncbi:32693_t:CDS:2 [Gigaspora margarita]|uniref:32693_t:CDS:1 n=1 Tax=Gigaspora margarita TaxID=4874 RepID=A0ABN7W192_GIGMA|nr:32693_t:CDS:2 [Gigaspora margarita]